jgi:hypothetical protein
MKVIKNPKFGELVVPVTQEYKLKWNGFGWDKAIENTDVSDTSFIKRISQDVVKEIPTGDVDGENFIFKLANSPIQFSEHLYLNGLLQKRGEDHDYIIIEDVVYFIEPPFEDSLIICSYSAQGYTEVINEAPDGDVDGKNNVFILRYLPIINTEHVYLNGLLQVSGQNSDYVLIGNKLSFFYPPPENSIIKVDYHAQ